MKLLKRFDEGLARGEAVIATSFLVSMIAAGVIQAFARHFATEWHADWANGLLSSLDWVDAFLKKGTLWLAFLGASLATRDERHIGIDLLPRLSPHRAKQAMRAAAALFSAAVSFFLARAFWSAVLVNANERPANLEVYGDAGAIHVCDATVRQLADARIEEVPSFFCVVRDGLGGLGVPIETPGAALQLVVPAMFIVIAARLIGHAVSASMALAKGPPDPASAREKSSTVAESTEASGAAPGPLAAREASSDAASDSDTDSESDPDESGSDPDDQSDDESDDAPDDDDDEKGEA